LNWEGAADIEGDVDGNKLIDGVTDGSELIEGILLRVGADEVDGELLGKAEGTILGMLVGRVEGELVGIGRKDNTSMAETFIWSFLVINWIVRVPSDTSDT
jgi:hypothetical protein